MALYNGLVLSSWLQHHQSKTKNKEDKVTYPPHSPTLQIHSTPPIKTKGEAIIDKLAIHELLK
jgi:hypothetical protein